MVSDYRTARSYVVFIYNNVSWTTYKDSVQGFQASQKRFTNIYTSLSSLAYKLPDLQGNHGILPYKSLFKTRYYILLNAKLYTDTYRSRIYKNNSKIIRSCSPAMSHFNAAYNILVIGLLVQFQMYVT